MSTEVKAQLPKLQQARSQNKVDMVIYKEQTDLKLKALLNSKDDMPANLITDRLNSILT